MSIEKLISALTSEGVEHKTNMPLSILSSFKIGGNASLAVFPKSREEMAAAVRASRAEGVRYAVIGRGSNVLFSDDGFDGAIILTNYIKQIRKENDIIYAETGVHLGVLASLAASCSLSGLEFSYGIPGSLGGAVFMNAGAYGGEMSDVVEYSDYYDPETDTFGRFSGNEQGFSYRESVYSKRGDLVILGASLKLREGDGEAIRALMSENMQKRKDKQPVELPSAGSAFKRPAVGFAAQMIDECGLKGLSIGGAAVSEKHAGFIVNNGGATANDVKALMKEVADRVYERFGVRLESEIRYID